MLILASGADKVRKFERALGGTPPKSDMAIRELIRMMRQRWEKRRAFRREMNKMLDRAQAPFREQFKKDPRIASSFKEMRRFVERRSKEPAPKLKRIKVEPQMAAGSGFSLHSPPYDAAFANTGPGAQISSFADQNSGDLGCDGTGAGDPGSIGFAGALVGSNFFALSDDPQQRAAAYVRWLDRWVDLAVPGYSSENSLYTYLSVWGYTEQIFVAQRECWPAWDVRTSVASGYSNKGSSGDTGDWEGGTESVEIVFQARANSWYTVYLLFNLLLGDTSGGSYAQASLNATVPFIVFGSI